MIGLRNTLKTSALAAVLVTGAIVATGSAASADTVCNRDGDCWQTSQRYTEYPSTLGITFYDASWANSHRHDKKYHWRENQKDDHGYYDRGEWHGFSDHH